MHKVGNYVFDTDRLIIYKSDICKETIDAINAMFVSNDGYESGLAHFAKLNFDEMRMDKIAINSVGIFLTYNCNLRCSYCGYSSTDKDKNKLQLSDVEIFIKDIIKKRAIKKLLTKNNEVLTVLFTGGGEPTYDWNLLKNTVLFIKRQCADNGIPLILKMTTNAILLDEQIKFISENFNYLVISYDGLPEIQNINRISPSIKDTNSIVERSIREFVDQGIPVTVKTTIWQNDFPKLREMYNHIFSIVPENSEFIWNIQPVMFEGRAIERIKQKDDKTYKNFLFYYIDLVEYIISEKGEEKLKMIYNTLLRDNDNFDIFCGAHMLNELWLLPDKSIVTCIEYKNEMVSVGKINDGKIEYFEKYYDNYLKIMQEKHSECRGCIAYRFCKGGCPVWHLRIKDEKNEIPAECHLQKEYWEYIIEAVLSNKYSFGWHLKKIDLPNIKEQEIFKLIKIQKESQNET